MQFISYHTHTVGRVLIRQYFLHVLSIENAPGGNQNFWLGSIQPEVKIKWLETGKADENIPGLSMPQAKA